MRCSMAVEVSGGATRPIGVSGAGAGGDGVGSGVGEVDDSCVDGSSLGWPDEVSSGKILISKITRKMKTQSPNHRIKGKEGSRDGVVAVVSWFASCCPEKDELHR